LTSTLLEENLPVTLINFYGPCTDRKTFWDNMVINGLLDYKNLIVAGDLNFIVSVGEVWGGKARLDPLAWYFKEIFQEKGLVDITPIDCGPTWRNGRSGMEEISKRLDKIYMAEDLLKVVGRHRSWVAMPFISDHAHVLLQLDNCLRRVTFPFKLNPCWLGEEGFRELVIEVWNSTVFVGETSAQKRLVWKLKVLKNRVKAWGTKLKHKKIQELELLEEN
jgi:hypothetical protein